MTQITASFHNRGWCPAVRQAEKSSIMRSASASQAHLRTVQVCPDWPGEDLAAAFLIRWSRSSLSIGGSCRVGRGRGSSWNRGSTWGGFLAKNLCDSMSATSSCEWTSPLGPRSEGTLESFRPWRHAATSQRFALPMYSSAHFRLAVWTVLLRCAWAAERVLSLVFRSLQTASEHSLFHHGAALG